jgi:acetolactate synthase small subunit
VSTSKIQTNKNYACDTKTYIMINVIITASNIRNYLVLIKNNNRGWIVDVKKKNLINEISIKLEKRL